MIFKKKEKFVTLNQRARFFFYNFFFLETKELELKFYKKKNIVS